ncbi:MAG: type II toxin-antitoxin system RelE/ParE family toxin [Anaerolineae bacterium]|nr:type II toxin-antitoxin system RelE/ParE family toxin [Anaerolineae bacterium]
MSEYTITFAQSARKELERLSANVVSRIFPKIEALAQSPRPPGCRKLQGFENLWRIRVGYYRVIYQVFDEELVVDIVAVRHRSKAYRLR